MKKKQSWRWGKLAVLSVLVLACAVCLFPADQGLATDSMDDYLSKQQQLQDEMAAQKKVIQQQNQEKKDLQSQISALDQQSSQIQKEMDLTEAQIDVTNQELDQLKADLATAEANLKERNDLLQSRVREIYMQGDVDYLDVLFQSSSYSNFLMRFDMLDRIVDQDLDLVAQVKAERAVIEDKKGQQEAKLNDLEYLKNTKASALQKLQVATSEKQEMMKAVDKEKAAAEAEYNAMAKASKEVASQIRRLQEENAKKNGTVKSSGIFQWPLPGNYTNITSEYGNRFHPILKKNKMHTGIDISAPNGTDIYAADSGVVIFSGTNTAYGNMIIIDHGNNISTLYGHMSKRIATSGQTVSKGDLIGRVGSTGWSTGNHLHFEVRNNGDPVSPWNYVSK